jgi:hypothetical protein
MGFLKKLLFWKRRCSDTVTTCNIATTTDNPTSETGTQVWSREMNLRRDVGTQVDSNLTHEASTQTPNDNEQPENRTDGGTTEKEQEQMKSERAALEQLLEEKDRHIRNLNAIIHGMPQVQTVLCVCDPD